MENTALNGTTTTEDHEDWKKKKGYRPLIVVAVSLMLLLGLALYAGGPVDGGSTTRPPPLPRDDEKEIPNVAASSLSLMGAGTATSASDMKTLTIVLDDDATINGVLSGWPRTEQRLGGSAARCEKNTGYNCGAVFPPGGDTCGQSGCCCNGDDGTGVKLNTCDNAKGYAYRGCNSCWEENACFKTNNVKIGDSSCHGAYSCMHVSDSTIYNDSCQGYQACNYVQNSIIHDGSCQGHDACYEMQNATIGNGSCNGGSDSISYNDKGRSCLSVVNVKIGNNSCNGEKVCYKCKHNVPDNACNQGITDDLTEDGLSGYCKFCGEKPVE